MRGIEKDLGLGPNYMCYFTNFISTKCYPTYLFSNKNISASSSRGAVGWGGILCTCLYLLLMQLDFPMLIKRYTILLINGVFRNYGMLCIGLYRQTFIYTQQQQHQQQTIHISLHSIRQHSLFTFLLSRTFVASFPYKKSRTTYYFK